MASFLKVIDEGLRALLWSRFKAIMGYGDDDEMGDNIVLYPKSVAFRKVSEKRGRARMDFMSLWRADTNFSWERQRSPLARHGLEMVYTDTVGESGEVEEKTGVSIVKTVPVDLSYDVWFWSKEIEVINQMLERYLFWIHDNPNLSLMFNSLFPMEMDMHFGEIVDESPLDEMYRKGTYFVVRAPIKIDGWVLDDVTLGLIHTITVKLWDKDSIADITAFIASPDEELKLKEYTIPESEEEEEENGGADSHYLSFYEIRYSVHSDPPLPAGEVDFTISRHYEDLDFYRYTSIATIYGQLTLTFSQAKSTAIILSDEEVETLMDGAATIKGDKVQKADIEKMYQEYNPSGEWEDEFTYGVMLDSFGDVILDDDNYTSADTTLANYRAGKTMVVPQSYGRSASPTRLFFNFNNQYVREYAYRRLIHTLEIDVSNCLFIDNFALYERQLTYIYDGTQTEQVEVYGEHILGILEQVKGEKGCAIIINAVRGNDDVRDEFVTYVVDQDTSNVLNGLLVENYFWQDDEVGEDWCTDVAFYQGWVAKTKAKNMKILFAYAPHSGTPFEYAGVTVFDVWLWTHLIADSNVYFYANDRYSQPMVDLYIYAYPLGQPVGAATLTGGVWERVYDKGTITFDTASGNLDEISFVES